MVQASVVRRLRVAGIVAVGTIALMVAVQAAVLEWRFWVAPVQTDVVNASGLRRSLTEAVLYRAERAATTRSELPQLAAAIAELDRAPRADLERNELAVYDAFHQTASLVMANPNDAALRRKLQSLGSQLYDTFDRATAAHAFRGNQQRSTLRVITLATCGVILIALALLYFFVMRRRDRAIVTAIAEIESRQQRFAAMFDHAFEMMCIYATDGTIVRANRSALRRLGFGKEVVGKHYSVHIVPGEREQAASTFAEALRGRAVEFSSTFLSAKDEAIPVTASLAPIVVAGEVAGVVGSARDETLRREYEAEIVHSRERLRALFKGSFHSILSVDVDGIITDVNAGFEALTGYRRDEIVGKHFTSIVPASRRDVSAARFAEMLEGNTRTYETTTLTRDGRETPVLVDATPIRVGDRIEGVFYTSRDLTAERALRQRLEQKDERISTLLQVAGLPWEASVQIDEAIFLGADALGMAYGYVVRIDGETMTVLHRHAPDDTMPVGHRMKMTRSIGMRLTSSARAIAIDDLTAEPYASELGERELPWKSFIGTRIHVAGVPFGAVVFLHREVREPPFDQADIEFVDILSTMLATAVAREVRSEDLREKATRDKLTGLANRAMLEEHFSRMVARARRADRGVAVHYIDLDGFKPVNDTYGHAAGDEVLCEVGRRFVGLVRGEDVVARIGGDEYAILQESSDESSVERLSQRLRALLEIPIVLSSGTPVTVGASIGVGFYPRDGADLQSVLEKADAAMYRDKRAKATGARGS